MVLLQGVQTAARGRRGGLSLEPQIFWPHIPRSTLNPCNSSRVSLDASNFLPVNLNTLTSTALPRYPDIDCSDTMDAVTKKHFYHHGKPDVRSLPSLPSLPP